MIIAGIEITASRWPWQGWVGTAPLNSGGARFGGGWKYKLGIAIGGSTVMLDLLFGIVTITRANRCTICGTYVRRKDKKCSLLSDAWPAHYKCAEQAGVEGAAKRHFDWDAEVPF